MVRLDKNGIATMALLGEGRWGNACALLVPTGLLRKLRLESWQHPPPEQCWKADVPSVLPHHASVSQEGRATYAGARGRGIWCIFRIVSHFSDLEEDRQERGAEERCWERAGCRGRGQALHYGYIV